MCKVFALFILTISVAFSANFYAGPIDIVYTWVNHKDKNWQESREQARASYPYLLSGDGNSKTRFRNRNELKYSLRSVFLYAPFVNHIYIVTSGQRPSWLKEHPKITIVPHSIIFKNTSDLPTFNSHAIEANLHRIPGLSEQYIYLNDDVFFGAPVKPSDFFTASGKMRLYFDHVLSPRGEATVNESGYFAGWKNTNKLLDRYFGFKLRASFVHGPFTFKKSVVQNAERRFSNAFKKNSKHKFRSFEDYTVTNGLIPYYAYYRGNAVRGNLAHITVWVKNNASFVKKQLSSVLHKKPATFCVEDMALEDSSKIGRILTNFFNRYFPIKGDFEE